MNEDICLRESAQEAWHSIKGRISRSYRKRNESYLECKLSSEWEDFENFLKWYSKNYVQGWQIDKDLFGWDTKMYSSQTCCFIPARLNSFLVNLRAIFEGEMHGWYYRDKYGVFVASVSDTGRKKIHLGHFKSEYGAKIAYISGKFKILDSIVNDYKNQLPNATLEQLNLLKYKILKHYGVSEEEIGDVEKHKIKRKRKSILVNGEEILVTEFASNINMNYRHLYALIFLKNWSLDKILLKYDIDGYYKTVGDKNYD